MQITQHDIRHDGQTIKLPGGLVAHIKTEQDEDHAAPWKENDGHGIVSDWEGRDKRAGERILHTDHGSKRFYDFAATLKLAKKDRWGLGESAKAALERKLDRKPTAKQILEAAVERDYEFLRGWCNDEWYYIGVIVTLEDTDGREVGKDSLWGVENCPNPDNDNLYYWKEVAAEMVNDLVEAHAKEVVERAEWAARDTMTVGA